MAWGKGGSKTLDATATQFDITGLSSESTNLIVHSFPSGASAPRTFEVNGTSGTYDVANLDGGGGIGHSPNYAGSLCDQGGSWGDDAFIVGYMMSIEGKEKIMIYDTVGSNSNGTAPRRRTWTSRSNSNTGALTSVTVETSGGSGSIAGSNFSILGSDKTPQAGKPTNVQAGSRWEETDTRKMYHYSEATLTFSDDFDTDSGWTTAGTSVIDTTNEYWRQIDRTPMYKSLGVSLDTTWVCDLDIYWTGIGTSGWQGYVMFTNYGATAYNSSTGTPQYIGLRQRTDGKETLRITNYAGGETNATDVFMATGASANTWYFYRVIRNGNDATLTRYTSDANRTSDTGGVSITSTGFVAQVSWDESVKIQYIDGTGYSSDQEYRIKNVKIYNGVTSTATAWKEEGT